MNRRAHNLAVVMLTLAVLAPRSPASDEEEGMDWGELMEQGAAWVEQLASFDVGEAVEAVASAEDMNVLLEEAVAALGSDSYELLAELEPYVRWGLGQLDQIEGAAPYADWLRQRLDFFEEATVYTRPEATPPPPARATVPPPARPPPARPPPARSSVTPRAPDRPVPGRSAPHDVEVWTAKLANRTRPRRADALVPKLKPIFREEGVPPALVWLAEVESSFNPGARSPVGAAGLYQLMPATARSLGVKVEPHDERLDAEKNARAAARYLNTLHRRFGSWDLALAAYNGGQGRVSGVLKRSGGRTFDDIATLLPSETRMYVPKVIATVQLRENVDLRTVGVGPGGTS